MCVIMILSPGASINKDQFFNAVWNNWNGYGVILKDGNGKLDVIKKCDDKGNDPEELWEIVEFNKDVERFVHVRYSTKGAIDMSNTQPFQVYNSNKRQVWFMHNGTLNNFGTNVSGAWGKSDTVDFCEKVISPSLLRWEGEHGRGDYLDPLYQGLVIDKHWQGFSRGLFISNDLDALRIGNVGTSGWQEYKHPDESSSGEVWVSNNEYFEKVSRGPRFHMLEAKRKAEEEARKAAEAKARQSTQGALVPFEEGDSSSSGGRSYTTPVIKHWDKNNARSKKVLDAFADIIETWDVDDPEQMKKLSHVAFEEWCAVVDDLDEITLAAFLKVITDHLRTFYNKNRMLTLKHQRASVTIEGMKKEIETLKKEVENVSSSRAA